MFIEIGANDVKTNLPELLRRVEQGDRFTITQRGRPIADLVPSQDHARQGAAAAVQSMLDFERVAPVSPHDIATWVAQGRR